MGENRLDNPLVELGRAIAGGRRARPNASRVERLRLVDQAIAAINDRRGLTEAQRARGIAALQRARARYLDDSGA